MSHDHETNQPRTYSDGVTRTPGVPRWERVASLFCPTPGAEAHPEWDDHGGSVEVHCHRHQHSDLSQVPYALRVDNHETGESAAVVMSSRAAVAVAWQILDAVTHGCPESLTDAEYFGDDEDRDDGAGDAPGNVLRFPGLPEVPPEDVDRLMGEIRDQCSPDGDQGDDTPGGAA